MTRRTFFVLLLRIFGLSIFFIGSASAQNLSIANPIIKAISAEIDSIATRHGISEYRLVGDSKWAPVIALLNQHPDAGPAILLGEGSLIIEGSTADLRMTTQTLIEAELHRDVIRRTLQVGPEDYAELRSILSVEQSEGLWDSTLLPILTAIGGAAIVALFFLIRS